MRCALLLVLALAAPARADDRPKHRTARAVIAAGTIVAHSLLTGPLADDISPDHCRWCNPNALDKAARGLRWGHRERAQTLSDVTDAGVAVVAASLLAVAAREAPCFARRFAEDALPIIEAYIYTEMLTTTVKVLVARQRPDVHFRDLPASQEDNLSFYSGHTSIAFSIAVASGLVAHRRGYRLAPAIWASTLALAATTGYLRIAGDRHYLTDVATGAAVGTLGGYAIPSLLEGRNLTLVPGRSGVALAGTF